MKLFLQLPVIGFLILTFTCSSQNETNVWYFGQQAGLNFSSNPPFVLTNGVMSVNEGCASVSNAAGNLLFYTDGQTIWNQNNLVMANGTGLLGGNTSSQSSLIVKQPGSQNLYYVFTIAGAAGTDGLNYSIVDMSLAAGLGSVTVLNASVYQGTCSEKITGTRHCNRNDYWIVVHEHANDKFRAYLLTSTGVNSNAVVSTIGTSYLSYFGCMKILPNGAKLGSAMSAITQMTTATVQLYDFNNMSGVVSNSLILSNSPTTMYGCEFSPDGSKFYACESNDPGGAVYQWDLCAGNNSAIVSSQYTVSSPGSGSMQMARNGKIYVARPGPMYMGVINNPNGTGAACNYINNAQSVAPKYCGYGLPNFISSSLLQAAPLTFTQGIGCLDVNFTHPSMSSPWISGCSAMGSAPSSVTWYFGDPGSGPANTSTLISTTHTYPSAGIYTVKLVSNYSGCASDSIIQIINLVNPTLTVNSASVTCSGLGTSTVFVQGIAGALSYSWTPSAQSGSVATNLSPGIYSISVQNPGSACIQTLTTNITPPLQFSASVSSTLSCTTASAAVTLTNASGNCTFMWNPGVLTASSVTGLAPAIYTVTVNDPVNQCSLTNTILISVLATPVLTVTGNFTLCPGATASVTALGANTYTWSNNLSAASITLAPTSNTNYTVTGTYTSSGCYAKKTITIIRSKCVGIDELTPDDNALKIYPNPNTGDFTIQAKHAVEIQLITETGQLLRIIRLSESNGYKEKLKDVKPGIYLVQVAGEQYQPRYKILVSE